MTPLSIYQQALDVVSAAALAGDFAGYIAMIDLPYLVHTETARHLITKAEDLRATFDTMSRGLAARGVTHYERIAREADYRRPRPDRGPALHPHHRQWRAHRLPACRAPNACAAG